MSDVMTRHELAVRIAKEVNMTQNQVADIIQLSLDFIVQELGKGRSVEFRNFGVFQPVSRKKRSRDGEDCGRCVVARFRPGKVMKEHLAKLPPDALPDALDE